MAEVARGAVRDSRGAPLTRLEGAARPQRRRGHPAQGINPVTQIGPRIAIADFDLGPYHIKKGWHIWIPVKALCASPAIFQDPDTFNPTRFMAAERDKLEIVSWIFAAGLDRQAVRELGYQVRPIESSVRDIHAWYLQTGQLTDHRERSMVHHELTIDVARPISEVYAFLTDVTKMPAWLTRCLALKKLSPGAPSLTAGDRLVYTYRERSRDATMEGTVEAAEPDRRIDMKFKDRMIHVRVGFELSPSSGGTRVRHYVEIEPQTFIVKLMVPFIRRGVVKDTGEDVAKLKRLIESRP